MTLTEIYENYPYMKTETLQTLVEELDSLADVLKYQVRTFYGPTLVRQIKNIESTNNEVSALIAVIKERSKENE